MTAFGKADSKPRAVTASGLAPINRARAATHRKRPTIVFRTAHKQAEDLSEPRPSAKRMSIFHTDS